MCVCELLVVEAVVVSCVTLVALSLCQFLYVFLFSIEHSHMLKSVCICAWLTSVHVCKYALFFFCFVLENLV
jgi:hypothetical protein